MDRIRKRSARRAAASARPLCLLTLALVVPGPAHGLEWELYTSHRLFSESLPEDVLFAQLRVRTATAVTAARTAYQLHAAATVRGRPWDALGLQLGLDTGLLEISSFGLRADGAELGDRFAETWFLGETYAELELGETGVLELKLGKYRTNVGEGAIFAQYTFGLAADVDLSLLDAADSWRFRLELLLPDTRIDLGRKQSPLVHLQVGYLFDPGSELRLFGALYADRRNGLEPILADAIMRGRSADAAEAVEAALTQRPILRRLAEATVAERIRQFSELYNAGVIGYDVRTSGVVGWIGLSGALALSALELDGALIGGFGRVRTQVAPDAGLRLYVEERVSAELREILSGALLAETAQEVKLRSLFAKLGAKAHVSSSFDLFAHALVASGDPGFGRADEADPSYRGFLSLAPLLPYTAIFFNGGVATTLASPAVVQLAPDGAGLLSVGLGAEGYLGPVRARGTAALMSSGVPSRGTQSRFLGGEVDGLIDLQLSNFLLLSLEAAVFVPGAYYGALPPGLQGILGLTLLLDGHAQLSSQP